MVRAQLVPEVVSAVETAVGLIPEDGGLGKGSVSCTEAFAAYMNGLANVFALCVGIALPEGAIATLRDDSLAQFEKLNSHPMENKCLARVEGKAYCGLKLTPTRASKESRRCAKHANSDLVGVVLNLPDSRPASLSPCPVCS